MLPPVAASNFPARYPRGGAPSQYNQAVALQGSFKRLDPTGLVTRLPADLGAAKPSNLPPLLAASSKGPSYSGRAEAPRFGGPLQGGATPPLNMRFPSLQPVARKF